MSKQLKNKLLIVESPAKAKTISKYLDNEYIVKASIGHIRDLPKSNKKAIDIEGGFIPHYEISKGKEDVVDEIRSLAKKSSEVLLATDPDREGEAIAWHIKEATGLKDPKRVVFHEITKDAVKEAIKHPRDIDMNLKAAQEARRVLDRLVGYDLSGLIWKKVRYGLSAGRVQSPALRIIMEREREIRAFISHSYWVITADVETKKKNMLSLTCETQPTDEKEVEKILKAGKEKNWAVLDVNESDAKRSPRAPFTTSTLQQVASSRLGFSPSRTMMIAQKLYEAGLITYMRTDSTNLGSFAVTQIASVVSNKFGKENHEVRVFKTKSKNAQEAHEAIRPTDSAKENVAGTPEQQKLYRLIWQRTVASQMIDAKLKRTNIKALPKSAKDIPVFEVTGSRLINPGWLLADPQASGEDVILPQVNIGDTLDLIKIDSLEKHTEPPARYSEAGLVKELEKRGIGRPSTYASIIKTIIDRGYVTKQDRSLVPTDTGDVVSSFLEKNFGEYISDTFTAKMEDELDEIAEGKAKYEKTLKDFYSVFSKEIKKKGTDDKITSLGDAPSDIKCPLCGSPMIVKLGRTGKFLSCSRFPDCKGARTMEGKELEGPKVTGEKCPECKDGNLVEREGRFGKFISCDKYPKCKYIKKDENAPQNTTGVKCPECGTGEIAERRGRFGVFYSCTNYPKCKFAMKSKPTGNKCTYIRDGKPCGHLMMEGTKTIPERCSDKSCPNHNPHKLKTQ